VIVATVGHVDHGKTTLVGALTGVDTDRLPEEKARGMSIELGFAYRELGGKVMGFIDVPGHERFVHTMVAGVAGIHHALIVVAADDGPMPQTIEHLAIVDLLGIASATVVITKVDRADAARVADVTAQVRSLLAGTAMKDARALAVSAVSGAGLDVLEAHLEQLARAWAPPPARGHFRLAVDRSFTLAGVGLVVTGTAFAGRVNIDDPVGVCPGVLRARVRGLHAQNRRVQTAGAGDRCALNLHGAGLEVDAVRRGDWIAAEALLQGTYRIDAELRMLADAAPVRQGVRVHVHLGAKKTTGRLIPLRAATLDPGDSGPVQLVLDEEIGALWGDRLIVRDWSAQRTLGGGVVLDPFAPARGRSQPARLALLEVLAKREAAEALAAMLEMQEQGVELNRFALARNLTPAEQKRLFDAVEMVRAGPEREATGFSPKHWSKLRERMVQALDHWHKRNPDAPGAGAEQLRRTAGMKMAPPIFAALVDDLAQRADLVRKGNLLHRPGHRSVMSPEQQRLWQRLRRLLGEGGLRPPPVGELAIALHMPPAPVEAFLKHATKLQLVVQVAENRFYMRDALLELARTAAALAAEHQNGLFAAAEFRDRTGIGRNLSIQVLQYFDGVGLTRRIGEARRVIRRPEDVFGPPS
jgi:selenocysteine-specific elongation factor